VVCRELSKTHEEIRRGTLAELAQWAAGGLLGEVALVVAGSPARAGARPTAVAGQAGETGPPWHALGPAEAAAAAVAEVAAREATGTPRKEAIAAVAAESGLRKREVYNAVVGAHRH
jgi:16S rRNA (cytidine1402-2'-O)-methyltransferase